MVNAHRIIKRRVVWSVVALVVLVAVGITVGCLRNRLAVAYEGDYWTVSNESGLTMTVESVEQNGVEIDPIWSEHIFSDDTYEFGNYYFPIANNTDKVRVGVRVNGMVDGVSYRVFDNTTITSADNGQIIYGDVRPSVYGSSMRDSRECWMERGEERCSVTGMANEYVLNVYFRSSNYSTSLNKQLVVRPAVVGSRTIEIMSVKQGEQDVFLDTTGWQITTWEETSSTLQTVNEYRIDDIYTPVTVTYKLKDLEIGKSYSVNVGSNYHEFKADATEKTGTVNLSLNMIEKHVSANIHVYRGGEYSESDMVYLYFRIADEDFVELGDLVIDEISQHGAALEPVENDNGWGLDYTFTANDAQNLTMNLHATRTTASMNYYISYYLYGSNGGYLHSERPVMVTGEELEMGIVLTIPAAFEMSEKSPFGLNISINTVGENSYYYSKKVIYQNYGTYNSSDTFRVNYYVDENVPRYSALMKYTNGEEIDYKINPIHYDAARPLVVRVTGERYDNARTYDVKAKVAVEGGETFYNRSFTATGAELNAGKDFALEGLTLSLPEFDASGSTSGYDIGYVFSLEIDDLEQSGLMIYAYDGWVNSIITYNGGEVVAMAEGGGIGGSNFMRMDGVTVRRDSLDSSKGAVLNYLGSGFDDSLNYNYEIYYNGNAGNSWWSAEAGTRIENGVLSGSYLNSQGLTVNVAVPGSESESMLYTLVISRSDGVVIISKDYIVFEDAPRIGTFKFTADSDSFMQTSAIDYRVARGTDIEATLTGAGFDDAAQYKLWVTYMGRERVDCEWEYCYNEVDLSSLNYEATVTGAQLNSSVRYDMAYNEAFNRASEVEVYFDVTGINGTRPPHGGMGGDADDTTGYAGHFAYIKYVNDDEVFREDGFQVNADGTVTKISQPDEPHGEIPVDNRTPGDVEMRVENGDTLVLVSSKPTLVIGFENGHYQLVEIATTIDDAGRKTNTYGIGEFDEVKVVLKGDADMNGMVSSADLNKATRSLVGDSLPAHRELTELERIILDVTGDNQVTSADVNRITRSLIGDSLPAYQAIGW